MARRPVTEAAAPYEAGVQYEVKLKQAVRVGKTFMLRPGNDRIVIDGAIAMQIADNILSSQRVS